MAASSGFTVEHRTNGDLVIRHGGRCASTVRGATAERLASRLERADEREVQHLLARGTGNDRRGNERR